MVGEVEDRLARLCPREPGREHVVKDRSGSTQVAKAGSATDASWSWQPARSSRGDSVPGSLRTGAVVEEAVQWLLAGARSSVRRRAGVATRLLRAAAMGGWQHAQRSGNV